VAGDGQRQRRVRHDTGDGADRRAILKWTKHGNQGPILRSRFTRPAR
jgi:hypothetical protein